MSGESILVIDDSKQIIEHLARQLLPLYGYDTLSAYDGESGLRLIREKNPDLIILDYNLPEMTGIDVMEKMVEESINIPVVLITGYGSEQSAIEAFRLGAKDYIIKPFTSDEIMETIDRALVEKRLLHDKNQLAEELRRIKSEISRQNHQMNTLFNIGKAITSLLSVDQVLERVLEASVYLTEAEESTIWMPDETGRYLHAYEKQPPHTDAPPLPQLPLDNSLVGQVMKTGQLLRQAILYGERIEVAQDYFARAILYLPLKLRGVTMGVLGVTNREAHRAFSRRDEFFLAILADYAAIALENARVFQAADQALAAGVEELNTLIEITHTITSSLDLEEVIRRTIHQVHDSWHIDASSIWLLDESKQVLKILANVGTSSELLGQFEVPLGVGFVGHVAQTGKWIYTNDVASHPIHYRLLDETTGFTTRSLMCVPLIWQGKVVGTMQLLNKTNGDFDDADVEQALSIGSAIAIAVTNALLFKEAESRKQQLEATLEHITSPILITDADNHLHLLNHLARVRMGLSHEAIGKPVEEVLRSTQLVNLLTQPPQERKTQPLQERVVLPDGSVWVPRVAPIPNHGRILILQDITHLQELEEAKDLFVATVSHDMRAPLNSIAGFATNLSSAGSLNPEQTLFVDRIVKASERMMDLVNGLLELAKINTHLQQTRQPCHMVEIVADVVNDFQGLALTQNQELILTTDRQLQSIIGDPTQLRSAVANLVDNAIKYSTADQKIYVTVTTTDEYIRITVRDEGKGIPTEEIPHIFEMFYRGLNSKETIGIGLGLALVSSVAKAHNGQVWVKSKPGQGSTFYLQLPVAAEPLKP